MGDDSADVANGSCRRFERSRLYDQAVGRVLDGGLDGVALGGDEEAGAEDGKYRC